MKWFVCFLKKYKKTAAGFCALLLLLFYFSLPHELFRVPYSFTLLDKDGQLLQARIADDGQWRFPYRDSIPLKYEMALLTYEDKHFYYHPGVDPLALARAMKQNLSEQKIKSGGSTLTMQVIRLSRGNHSRNLLQKCVEIILALRLECRYSKKEILQLYAGHAPFGGNVVGVNAAAWRYFGRNITDLSWAEAATLAVLPNSPALIHPGRNRNLLQQKRDRLLDKLLSEKIINVETNKLSKLEKIPDKPLTLPQLAPHLLTSLQAKKIPCVINENHSLRTTLNKRLQEQVTEILFRHHQQLCGNSINNAAALVMQVNSGNVLAYVGNVYRPDKPEYDSHVDIITSPRSPGSILKPILYEAMLHDGFILPKTLIADIPTQISGYSPQNFDLEYDGAVPASRALARSLNIPAIRLLQNYRTERFYYLLKKLGITTLTKKPGHYGLSLILGGGENTLWELAGVYGSMARTLNHYSTFSGRYDPDEIHMPRVTGTENPEHQKSLAQLQPTSLMSAACIFSTFEAMEEVMRPGEELLWQQFTSAQRIAWKTGTSFGFRDGWAIGVTPTHVVAVWVGNADGEGRPGLIGVQTAAPILFDIFRLLPKASAWFQIPYDELTKVPVCKRSGYRAHSSCEPVDSMLIPESCLRTAPCPYHQLVHLDPTQQWRVNSDCVSPTEMVHKSWFVLPPAMEWYFKSRNPDYKSLPPYRHDCLNQSIAQPMEMIYPKKSNRIFVPVELDGKTGKCVFEVAHRNKETLIHWHLNDIYIGSTKEFHQMALSPPFGKHTLVLIDQNGERLEHYFEVVKH